MQSVKAVPKNMTAKSRAAARPLTLEKRLKIKNVARFGAVKISQKFLIQICGIFSNVKGISLVFEDVDKNMDYGLCQTSIIIIYIKRRKFTLFLTHYRNDSRS